MKKTSMKKWLSFFLCIVLIAAMALTAVGCGSKAADPAQDPAVEVPYADGSELGQGTKEFALTVADKDGNETHFTIHTDAATVGEALLSLGLIEGDQGDYGLYVKTVNGVTADYDTDGVYWAFYIDGEYAMTGVDATEVTAGATYALRIES